jgi:hypothetical protein
MSSTLIFENFAWSLTPPKESSYDFSSVGKFLGSDFDTTLNVVMECRPSSNLQRVDYEYNPIKVNNLGAIISKSALRETIPDSNYSSLRSILPRYKGVKLQSLKYNEYTPPTLISESVNYTKTNISGSWNGDISYGKNSVIDKHPVYMAYFKTSYENYSIWNTYQYEVENLIYVPNEDINEIKDYDPIVLKLEGNNDYLYEIVGAFEGGRKLDVSYNNILKEGIDYSSIKKDKQVIIEPGVEYITITGNQTNPVSSSLNWYYERFLNVPTSGTISRGDGKTIFPDVMLITGSNCFYLKGGTMETPLFFTKPEDYNQQFASYIVSESITDGTSSFEDIEPFYPSINGFIGLKGPHLAITHTYNQCVKNQIIYSGSEGDVGIVQGLDPNNKINYLKWTPVSSNLPFYKNSKEPFLIQPLDEIRINFQYNSGSTLYSEESTFKVSGISTSSSQDGLITYFTSSTSSGVSSSVSFPLNPIYDIIEVTPDPSTLLIPSGSIYSFTIRRKIQSDSNILLDVFPPLGSKGVLTQSGGGFLIPNDFSKVQRKNIIKIINILKNKNAFELESGIGNNILRIDPNTGELYAWV